MKQKLRITLIAAALAVVLGCAAVILLRLRGQKKEPVPVVVETVILSSSNPIPSRAKPGDRIALRFTLSRPLEIPPVVEIAGKPADSVVRESDSTYLATSLVEDYTPEGTVSFVIKTEDPVSVTTNDTEVSIDVQKPDVVRDDIVSDSQYGATKATAGDTVVLEFSVNEELQGLPEVLLSGKPADQLEKISELTYRARRKMGRHENPGPITYRLSLADITGNQNTLEGIADEKNAVQYSHPVIHSVSISSDNPRDDSVAGIGDIVTLEFRTNQKLSETPSVRFSGDYADKVIHLSDRRFSASTEIRESMKSGTLQFSVYIADVFGNAASIVSQTNDRTRIAVDSNAPVLEEVSLFLALGSDKYAVPGSSIVVDILANEPLSGAPYVKINDIPATTISKTSDRRFLATRQLSAFESEGPVSFSVDYNDLALNPGRRVSATTDGTAIVFTLNPPEAARLAEAVTAKPEQTAEEQIIEEQVVEEVTEDLEKLPDTKIIIQQGTGTDDIVEVLEPLTEQAVEILTPKNQSEYGAYAEISGRIGLPDTLETLSYRVSPTLFLSQESAFIEGELPVVEEGAFGFIFETLAISGSQDVEITARYTDGTTVAEKITLIEGKSGIPTFQVASEKGNILIKWDDLPVPSRYQLQYTIDSDPPSEGEGTIIDSVVSPVQIESPELGRRYTFLLKALQEDNTERAASLAESTIPLDSQTLQPSIKELYKRIQVSWQAISGSTTFQIFRSRKPEGPYENISGTVEDTQFLDTEVKIGWPYYYSVRPAQFSNLLSAPGQGESLPLPTERISILSTWREAALQNVTVQGNYIYAAAGSEGLLLIDVSNPDKPKLAGVAPTFHASDVEVKGDFAYVADGERGLKIIDIYNPISPVETGSRKTSDAKRVALEVKGETVLAYIADGTFGLKVIDASNPKDPVRRDSVSGGDIQDVSVYTGSQSSFLYVCDATAGVNVYNTGGIKAGPVALLDIKTPLGMAINRDLLFVACGEDGLRIYDLSTPENPPLLSVLYIPDAQNVTAAGGFAYVANGKKQLSVVDMSAPRLPVLYDTVDVEGIVHTAVRGLKLFASGDKGLSILSNYSKGDSVEVAAAATDGSAFGITLSENPDGKKFAYVADHAGGMKIYDVTDPLSIHGTNPAVSVPTEYARDIFLQGSRAYIADGPGGLKIFDVSPAWDADPETLPLLLGQWDTDGNARSIKVVDNLAFVADGNRGLKVFDITDPENLSRVSQLQTEYAVQLAADSHTVYLADGDGGLKVIQLKENTLEIISTVDTRNTRGVSVQNNLAYVVGSAGLVILDVSDAADPKVVGTYDSGYAEGINVEGRYAYLAEGMKGLAILDVKNPESPYLLSTGENRFTVDVAVTGPYALVADSEGIKVIRILIPSWVMRE